MVVLGIASVSLRALRLRHRTAKAERAKRFVLRSIAGALAGLGLHALATRIWGKGEKTE